MRRLDILFIWLKDTRNLVKMAIFIANNFIVPPFVIFAKLKNGLGTCIPLRLKDPLNMELDNFQHLSSQPH